MRSNYRLLLSLAAAAAITPAAMADIAVFSTSISNFLPNTNNQQLQLFVTGTDQVAGQDLYLQLNTNQDLPSPVFTGVPSFSSIDIITGTIFATSNTGQNNGDGADSNPNNGILDSGTISGHIAIVTTTTVDPDTVLANGLLATVNINTTGIASGVYQLRFLNTLNGDSFLTLPNINGDKIFPLNVHNNTNNSPAFLISVGDPTRQWAFNGSGDWTLNTNWTPFAPYAAGDQANFLSAVATGTANVALNGNRTTGNMTFNNTAASYNITQGTGGVLTLNNGGPATISNLGGNHSISAPLALTGATTLHVANSNNTLTFGGGISGASHALSLTGNGKVVLTGNNASKVANVSLATIPNGTTFSYTPTLDLSSAILIVTTTDPTDRNNKINSLNAALVSGETGSWTGTGIASSTAAAAPLTNGVGVFDNAVIGRTQFGGVAVSNSTQNADIFVAVARLGDTNRDNIVDILDLGNVANNWQQSRNSWTNGDINRDGVVDILDLGLVANNWQQTASFFGVAMESFPQLSGGAASVPEPSSVALLAIGGIGLLYRGRRRK